MRFWSTWSHSEGPSLRPTAASSSSAFSKRAGDGADIVRVSDFAGGRFYGSRDAASAGVAAPGSLGYRRVLARHAMLRFRSRPARRQAGWLVGLVLASSLAACDA